MLPAVFSRKEGLELSALYHSPLCVLAFGVHIELRGVPVTRQVSQSYQSELLGIETFKIVIPLPRRKSPSETEKSVG